MLDIESTKGTDLLATCRELGITVVPTHLLVAGCLPPPLAAARRLAMPTISGRWYSLGSREKTGEKNVKLVSQFKELADKKGCTTSQLAIAWLMKQGDDIIPIPGTKKIKYLEENWGS